MPSRDKQVPGPMILGGGQAREGGTVAAKHRGNCQGGYAIEQ